MKHNRWSPLSFGHHRLQAPTSERAIRTRKHGGLRASLRPLRVTVGGKKGGVFAFLGSKLMRFSGWRTSERRLPHTRGRWSRRTDGRRHHKTPGRVAAESLDSNQWQIATELKKATGADPHGHSPLIWLQPNPALNPRLRSQSQRAAAGQRAAGVGVQNSYRKHTCFVLGTSTKATLSSSSSSLRTVTRGRKRTSRQGWGCGSRARAPARVLPPLARVAFCSTREESRSGLGRSPSHLHTHSSNRFVNFNHN